MVWLPYGYVDKITTIIINSYLYNVISTDIYKCGTIVKLKY